MSVLLGFIIWRVWRVPAHVIERLEGVRLNMTVVKDVFTNKNLWMLATSAAAAYGTYMGASQLFPVYAQDVGFSETTVMIVGIMFGVAGIPACIFAGWLQQRHVPIAFTIFITSGLTGLTYLWIPFETE